MIAELIILIVLIVLSVAGVKVVIENIKEMRIEYKAEKERKNLHKRISYMKKWRKKMRP
jgi:hypothetical protein